MLQQFHFQFLFSSFETFCIKEFNENVHGTFNTVVGDTLTKNECGNLVTHTTDVPKSEIQVCVHCANMNKIIIIK